jgi:hypothetical protein
MAEDPRPQRTPGGYVPPQVARPRAPESNGHGRERGLEALRPTWTDLDAEDERTLAAQRTAFERVADVDPQLQVRASARPSLAVVVGVAIVVGLVVLAVVLYRMAPP